MVIMSSKMLYDAIALVRAGKYDEARQNIFEIIRTEPQNEMAWMWLAETLSSDVDRMKVLHACLQQNPESKLTHMAIERLQEKMDEEVPAFEVETPFSEDGTFDPTARERTGHTGAIIGFDGSFIVSEVPDFDDVIDLRTPAEDDLIIKPTLDEPDEIFKGEGDTDQIKVGQANLSEIDQETEKPEEIKETEEVDDDSDFLSGIYDDNVSQNNRFSKELEFEPDLSALFESEDMNDDQYDQADTDATLISETSSGSVFSGEDSDSQELSIEELGFTDAPTVFLDDDSKGYQAAPIIDDFNGAALVEDRVLENNIERNTSRRKSRDRRLIIFIAGLFLLIAALCVVAILVIGNYSLNASKKTIEPALAEMIVDTPLPTAETVLLPTMTFTPLPIEVPTVTPTSTPLVPISDKAINPDNTSNIVLRLNQNFPGKFYRSLDGNKIAFPDGNSIQVWNVSNGELLFTLKGHNNSISDIAFSSDGNYLVSGSVDFSVNLWNLQSGNLEKSFSMDGNTINRIYGDSSRNFPRAVSVDYSPDGTTLTAGAFGIVNIFDIQAGFTRGTFALSDEELSQASQNVSQLSGFKVKFNENGWVISAAMSKRLMGFDSLDAAPLYLYELGDLASVDFNDDRIRLVEKDIGGVFIRNLVDGNVINGFDGRREKPNQAAPDYQLSENEQIIGIEADGSVVPVQLSIWDVIADNNLMNLTGLCLSGSCRMPNFALSADGNLVAYEVLGNDGSVELSILDLNTNAEIHQFNQITDNVKSTSFSPDGRLVAAIDNSGVMHIWDVAIGVERVIIQTNNALNVMFSRNGQVLYAWSGEFLQAWSLP
jgi:WD40 repeat protein